MAKTRMYSRMNEIEMEIKTCEDLYAASFNESEKAGLSKQMSKLTTEYIGLATKVAVMV